ncbi:hypothetical protein D3C77_598240 [compost metagenome]
MAKLDQLLAVLAFELVDPLNEFLLNDPAFELLKSARRQRKLRSSVQMRLNEFEVILMLL